ncbi:MAG: hypothetical protein ACNS60_05130 [Candidatus Cyclobacteriaceae bacterium M2_1C_046]
MKPLFKLKLLGLLCIISSLTSGLCYAQQSLISLEAGISWRSNIVEAFDMQPVDKSNGFFDYNYKRNIQGLSFTPAIKFNHPEDLFSIRYYPNVRYDHPHYNEIQEFILDHNFDLMLNRKIKYGIGYSLLNYGKGISYMLNDEYHYHSLQFQSLNVFAIIPYKKLDLEIKAHYLPHEKSINPDKDYLLIGLRLFYDISLPVDL